MTTKIHYRDIDIMSININSTWKSQGKESMQSIETQTPKEMYQFNEMETQTGIGTQIIQSQVSKKDADTTILDYFVSKYGSSSTSRGNSTGQNNKKRSKEDWKQSIETGYVTVDCEVCTDPATKVYEEYFVECVNMKRDVEIQTTNDASQTNGELLYSRELSESLRKLVPSMEKELEANAVSRAFDTYQLAEGDTSQDISFWKLLTVDLEKRKVVFPDWMSAKHHRGRISRCSLTRNKERIYDVDYDDESKLAGVREEHIRLLDPNAGKLKSKAGAKSGADAAKKHRLQEGVRVHCKVTYKSGDVKYLPGRIAKCNRNGSYDVECEGSRMENGMLAEDLIVGLEEGQMVEARRPNKVHLQCTGVAWNATGNTLAAAYGRNDIAGWCEFPGAVCLWSIFSKSFNPDNPDFVLDHPSCLMCVRCHPTNPALVAAGSFNGEVIVWDITSPEQPVGISVISEYAHKEPVLGLEWVELPNATGTKEWMLTSVGADGKILFWSTSNGFQYPVRGSTLGVHGRSSKKRQYPSCHGATSLAFTGAFSSSTGSSSSSTSSQSAAIATGATVAAFGSGSTAGTGARWLLVGQEGGAIARGQLSRILAGPLCSQESFRTSPAVDDIFPSLRRGDESFAHDPHIGAVTSIDCSPFHRNLFLSCGGDGSAKLFHLLEKQPLRQWDPVPAPGTPGVTSTYSTLTCARFSPIRPLVFATGSADGFLFIFDLSSSMTSPVATLEALAAPVAATTNGSSESGDASSNGTSSSASGGSDGRTMKQMQQGLARRAGITGVAFNHKQRDLIAACDSWGRVHIWRLTWRLANKAPNEQSELDSLGRTGGGSGDIYGCQ